MTEMRLGKSDLMLDDCDYDKRLGANLPNDFPGKRFDRKMAEKANPTEHPVESSESSSMFLGLFWLSFPVSFSMYFWVWF